MKNKAILLVFVLLGLLAVTGCNTTDDIPFDPKEAVLGKWKLIESGSGFNDLHELPYTGYIEFFPNDSIGEYDSNTKKYAMYKMKYSIDSLLIYRNGQQIVASYKYKFHDDLLDLELYNIMAEIPCFRFKRMK